MQRMTEEEIRRDVRLAKAPEHQVRVLAELNCTTQKVIRSILSGQTWDEILGIGKPVPRGKGKGWTSSEIALVIKMRNERCTLAQIAKALGRTGGSVRTLIERNPEKFPVKHLYRPFSAEDERIAREWWGDGKTLSQIGDKLGRAPTTIRVYLRRVGLYPRAEKERAAHDTPIS